MVLNLIVTFLSVYLFKENYIYCIQEMKTILLLHNVLNYL